MKKIVRKYSVRVRELSSHHRANLEDKLVDIVRLTFHGLDHAFITDHIIFRDPDAKITIFYGHKDEIAGFMSFGIKLYEINGREHSVIDCGVHLKKEYRGQGKTAVWVSLLDALIYKARTPGTPLLFVGIATSPVSYRTVARQLHVYPNPYRPAPDNIKLLVRHVIKDRHLLFVGNDSWRVSPDFEVKFRDEARLNQFLNKTEDPSIDFYLKLNPDFSKGDFLVVAVPLNALDFLKNTIKMLQKLLKMPLPLRPIPRTASFASQSVISKSILVLKALTLKGLKLAGF